MKPSRITPEQIDALSALAAGIIPPDECDADAAMLNAGECLAQRIVSESNGSSYFEGLQFAETTAKANFGREISKLDAVSLESLLVMLRDQFPAFFKFLRAETCALYLKKPAVWKRIGFFGPSIQSGGHPDFDHPQIGPLR